MFSICLSRTTPFLVYPVWPRPSSRNGIIQAPRPCLSPEFGEWEVPARDGRWRIKNLSAGSQVSSSKSLLLSNVMPFIKQYNNDFLNNYFQTTPSSSCSFSLCLSPGVVMALAVADLWVFTISRHLNLTLQTDLARVCQQLPTRILIHKSLTSKRQTEANKQRHLFRNSY